MKLDYEFERLTKDEQVTEIHNELTRVIQFAIKHGYVVTVEYRHPSPLEKPVHVSEVRPARGNY